MSEQIVFLNGNFIAQQDAHISPMDRGFLFGDGVYEVVPVYGENVFGLQAHLQRLQNSCDGIRLRNPHSLSQWQAFIQTLLEKNRSSDVARKQDYMLYIQVTRGAAEIRNHLFPQDTTPTSFMYCRPMPALDQRLLTEGARLITADETRWQYCHLKTTSLVANVLLKQMADDANADEVILFRDGYAQECSVSNFFIVKDNVVLTPPKTNYLLPGITRDVVLQLLVENTIAYQEKALTLADIENADEIWTCSSTKEVVPATMLNNKPVGNGKPGKIWQTVYDFYQASKQA